MPYAIKANGFFRSVDADMELDVDETLFDVFPDWLVVMMDSQRADSENLLRESEWKIKELSDISRQLEAIEESESGESPPDLLPGTRKQWLRYRGQVSNWKEGAQSFPDIAQRPVRPS